MQLRIQDLNLGIGLDVTGLDLTGANGIDVDRFDAGAVQDYLTGLTE